MKIIQNNSYFPLKRKIKIFQQKRIQKKIKIIDFSKIDFLNSKIILEF